MTPEIEREITLSILRQIAYMLQAFGPLMPGEMGNYISLTEPISVMEEQGLIYRVGDQVALTAEGREFAECGFARLTRDSSHLRIVARRKVGS